MLVKPCLLRMLLRPKVSPKSQAAISRMCFCAAPTGHWGLLVVGFLGGLQKG